MDSLESRISAVLEEFSFAGDWNDRYRLLVEWGEGDTPLADHELLPEWEVFGCSSPLWLRVRWLGSVVEVRGASPGLLPRALVALLVRLFDGLDDVSGATAEVLDSLDLRRNLSPSRGLVFERMLERVRTSGRTES
jgi:cysteine desulfuration protein SufE